MFFIRHGESAWNDRTVFQTVKDRISQPVEFRDTYLSKGGLDGARKLQQWIFSDKCQRDQCFLSGRPFQEDADRRVLFAVSNLRRAILTALIAFEPRIKQSNKDLLMIRNMHVLNSLQEITKNIDSDAVTPPYSLPLLSFDDAQCPFTQKRMADFFITECSEADNKDDRLSNSGLDSFCAWLREMSVRGEPTADASVQALDEDGVTDFVIAGHSMWLRKFFQNYIGKGAANPSESGIRSSTKVLSHEAVVKFEVDLPAEGGCTIVPGKTDIIYGGLKNRYKIIR